MLLDHCLSTISEPLVCSRDELLLLSLPRVAPAEIFHESSSFCFPKVLLVVSFLAPLAMFLCHFPLCGGVERGTAMARQ